MQHALTIRSILCLSLAAALPVGSFAATPAVDGITYTKLSTAVAAAQLADNGPHVINVTIDNIVNDGEIVITEPMTINGDANNNGKCDVLVDMTTIQAATSTGNTDSKSYIEIQCAGAVTINDLKIHPNADCTAANVANSVDGIRMYEPATGSGTYVLNRVWVSGSDSSASHVYVDLATATAIHATSPKKWSFATGTGTVASGTNAVIQILDGAGTANIELNNCHAGLGESNAVNINSRGGTTKITGGLYGHVSRDGIRTTGNGITLTGSHTNRLRVVRSTNSSGGDGHAVEIYGAAGVPTNIALMEYVDVAGMNTSQLFKVWGNGGEARVQVMRYCRGLGKLATIGNNPSMFVGGDAWINSMSNCTIVGSAGGTNSQNPFVQDGTNPIEGDIHITDCIFTSTGTGAGAGVLNLVNTDSDDGVRTLANCGIPNDLFSGESLAADPITGNEATFTPVGNVSASPHYVKVLADYDWSESAVSINGTDPLAGNPSVLRPSDAAYTGAASDGSNLTGGAGWRVRSSQPTVTNATFISPNVLEITFSETMGNNAFLTSMYTLANVAQRGTLTAQPDSVSWISATTYRLTWNTGARAGGQFQMTFDSNLADTTGQLINAPSGATVPVAISAFSME